MFQIIGNQTSISFSLEGGISKGYDPLQIGSTFEAGFELGLDLTGKSTVNSPLSRVLLELREILQLIFYLVRKSMGILDINWSFSSYFWEARYFRTINGSFSCYLSAA
ncbi:hypothetical protein [Paenibacillus sp. GCM10012306]|uniref:hypothetical protein n=1 Tax=Paenibacillus sp. GCM10012306 TaxID=3317342 RepID=UPI0036D3B1FD